MLTLAEVLAAEHFRARGAIARTELAPGIAADVPTGLAEIDGRRVDLAPPRSAGSASTRTRCWPSRSRSPPRTLRRPARRRVARSRGSGSWTSGVIVFGAELARLFCELGAEVIKIESRAFPDGARVSPVHFAIGHRGSRSLGVEPAQPPRASRWSSGSSPKSDVVLANFKPGTLEKLGLGAEALREINPGIVVVNGSALGASGPWSSWMGYGPLVRCVSGLTSLWRYPDDDGSFSDSTMIHPDHYAARLSADHRAGRADRPPGVGSRRRRSRISQAETILVQLASLLASESLAQGRAGGAGDAGGAAAWGLYPCAGDDEWCVVTVRDDDDWRRLRRALGDPGWAAGAALASAGGRVAHRFRIDAELSAWTRARPPREVAALLQRAGVPAGFMQRPEEYEDDPQFQARDFLRTFEQPGLAPMRIEHAPFRSERIPPPPNLRAPEQGEHTLEICARLLDMDERRRRPAAARRCAGGAATDGRGRGEGLDRRRRGDRLARQRRLRGLQPEYQRRRNSSRVRLKPQPAAVGTGREQPRNRIAALVEHPRVRVDQESAERERDRWNELGDVVGRIEQRRRIEPASRLRPPVLAGRVELLEASAHEPPGVAPLLGQVVELVEIVRHRTAGSASIGEPERVDRLDPIDVRSHHPLVVDSLVADEQRAGLRLIEHAKRVEMVSGRLVDEASAVEVQQDFMLAVVEGRFPELVSIRRRDPERNEMAVEARVVLAESGPGAEAQPTRVASLIPLRSSPVSSRSSPPPGPVRGPREPARVRR